MFKVLMLLFLLRYGTCVVKDGSFEDQTLFWKQQGKQHCILTVLETPVWNNLICSLTSCPKAKNYTPGPKQGNYFVWLAGFGVTSAQGNVSQPIRLPHDASNYTLSFWLSIRTTGPNDSLLTISLGSKILTTFCSGDNEGKWDWVFVSFDFDSSNIDCDECMLYISYDCPRNGYFTLTHYFIDVLSIVPKN